MMKTTMISLNVYEMGDVLKLHNADFKLAAKQRNLDGARLAMVISAKQRLDKLYTYKVVTDTGVTLMITPSEQGNEEFVGHVDLSMLTGSMVSHESE